jgi:hypothetical protein
VARLGGWAGSPTSTRPLGREPREGPALPTGGLLDALEIAERVLAELDPRWMLAVAERFDQAACVVVGAGARQLDRVELLVRVPAAVDLAIAALAECQVGRIVSVSVCPVYVEISSNARPGSGSTVAIVSTSPPAPHA